LIKDYKILVGCMLVPHKLTVMEIFLDSIFSQTHDKFDVTFTWGHRERSTDIDREEILRVRDMTNKVKKLWDLFVMNQYDFLMVTASDTWYPPDTLEKTIAYFEKCMGEGHHVGRISARTYNRVRRASFKEPQDIGEYAVDDWGGAFDFYTYFVRDRMYPRHIIDRDENKIYSSEVLGMQDAVRVETINVTPDAHVIPNAYHLYISTDVLPDKEECVMGGLPIFLKEKYINKYADKIKVWNYTAEADK
jgi:hypothetical protein